MPKNVLIMGAAGKDFHVFNTCYRQDPESRVVAFTATQIPHISDRRYPASLAGKLYPDGIPIHPEEKLVEPLGLDEGEQADLVAFLESLTDTSLPPELLGTPPEFQSPR